MSAYRLDGSTNSRCIGRTVDWYWRMTDSVGRPRSLQSPDEAQVRVGVDEDLYVEELAQGGFGEDQDALHQDYAPRRDCKGLARPAVPREIVNGHFHRPPFPQRANILDQEIGFERMRVVEVHFGPLGWRQTAQVFVVGIVLQVRDLIGADALQDGLCNRGLA